jgi:hypothetical protein
VEGSCEVATNLLLEVHLHYWPCLPHSCRMSVAQELQELVQLQQQELQKLQQQQQQASATTGPWGSASAAGLQLEAANAELRQQLQGTTSRLQDMEAAMSRLLQQQVWPLTLLQPLTQVTCVSQQQRFSAQSWRYAPLRQAHAVL